MNYKRNSFITILVKYRLFFFISIIVVLEIIFFRNIMGNGKLLGGSGDGRLTMLLAEHWWRFFTGKDHFRELLMFYPAKGTLGFSDMLLVFGIIHSVFRFFGIDMYLAYKFTLMVIHGFGSVSFFYLMYKKLQINLFWSFFALISFSYSTVFSSSGFGHSQLSAINLLPVFACFFTALIQNWNLRKFRNLNATFLIATYAFICYTAWYIAFFTALFCLILAASYMCQMMMRKESVLQGVKSVFITFKFDLLFLLSFAIVLMIPFAMVYLPVFVQSAGYDYNEIKCYMPEIIDFINVTRENLMFGKTVSAMHLQGGEVAEGFSIIVLSMFIFVHYQSKKQKCREFLTSALFISVLVSLFICIKLNSSGLSLWYFVYHFIPGGSSIRAVGRFLFYLSFPLSLYIALCGNKLKVVENLRWNKQCILFFSLLFLSFFFISQMRKGGVSTRWHRQDQKKYLATVPNPPVDAESFYLIPNINDKKSEWYLQLNAYEIASTYGIPTLNGYSGQEPEDWHGIWIIKDEGYLSSVNKWIRKNNLENVYAYDENTKTWKRHSYAVPSLTISKAVFFNSKDHSGRRYFLDGLSGTEEQFTWTDGNRLVLQAALENVLPSDPVHACFNVHVFNGSQRVIVSVNDYETFQLVAQEGRNFEFDFHAPPDGNLRLVLEFPDAVSPKDLGISGDARKLALAISSLTFTQKNDAKINR